MGGVLSSSHLVALPDTNTYFCFQGFDHIYYFWCHCLFIYHCVFSSTVGCILIDIINTLME